MSIMTDSCPEDRHADSLSRDCESRTAAHGTCSWWGWPPTGVMEDEGFHSTEMKPLKFCPSAEAETGSAVAPEQNCPQKLTE